MNNNTDMDDLLEGMDKDTDLFLVPVQDEEDDNEEDALCSSLNTITTATSCRSGSSSTSFLKLTPTKSRRFLATFLILLVAGSVLVLSSLRQGAQLLTLQHPPQQQQQQQQQMEEVAEVDFSSPLPSPPSIDYFYYNLSCPLEFSKYSCVHAGHEVRAKRSLNAVMGHQETMTHIFRQGLQPYSRLLLVGDSTMRQIFIAMGCLAMSVDPTGVQHAADWQPSWPCKNTPNCMPGGVHSGFSRASLRFANGASVHYVALGGVNGIHEEKDIVARYLKQMRRTGGITFGPNTAYPIAPEDAYLNATDTLVLNVGVHNTLNDTRRIVQAFAKLAKRLQTKANRPNLVYMSTLTQHFATPDGQYDGMTAKTVRHCIDSVPRNPRAEIEYELIRSSASNDTRHSSGKVVDAFVDYFDLDMGAFHVGKLDCTHYCMPGPPDWMAARIFRTVQGLQAQHRTGQAAAAATTTNYNN